MKMNSILSRITQTLALPCLVIRSKCYIVGVILLTLYKQQFWISQVPTTWSQKEQDLKIFIVSSSLAFSCCIISVSAISWGDCI